MEENINYYFANNNVYTKQYKIVSLLFYKNIKILTYVCPNKTIIPSTLNNLEELYFHQDIDIIPKYFNHLKILYCNNTGIINVPTFLNLYYLDCSNNPDLIKLPENYKNIKKIIYKNTGIK